MRYNPEADGDVLDLLEAGFTEAPVELGSDGPVSVFSPPAMQENPVQEYQETTRQMLTLGVRYLSVNVERFTAIPKIGLNPQNKYDTPTGLYWYDSDMPHADFATDRKYVIRATLAGSGVDLGNLDDEAVDTVDNLIYAIERTFAVRPAWAVKKRIRITYADVNKQSASWVEDRVRSAGEQGLDEDAAHAAALWWAVTRLAAKQLAKREGRRLVDAWTTVFRSLGINFVYDPGFGVIHTSEPAQVVSFDPRAIQHAELDELEKSKRKRTKLVPLFKFMPPKYRFRADEETGLTAQQRIKTEGVRPCEAVQLLYVDRAARSFTRRTVSVGDVVAFALTTKSADTEPVNLKIDMVLHDKVLVSLVRDDGEPLSREELRRLNDLDQGDFFKLSDVKLSVIWGKTFFQCGTFGEVSASGGFSDPRRACAVIKNAVVPGADFSLAVFRDDLIFENCYFPKALFEAAAFTEVTFTNCYLRDASFKQAKMQIVYFERCLPQDADFSRVSMADVDADPFTAHEILKTHGTEPTPSPRGPTLPGLQVSRIYEDIRWQAFWPEPKPDDRLDVFRKMRERLREYEE